MLIVVAVSQFCWSSIAIFVNFNSGKDRQAFRVAMGTLLGVMELVNNLAVVTLIWNVSFRYWRTSRQVERALRMQEVCGEMT